MLKKALLAFVLALAGLGAFQIQTHEAPIPGCYPCPRVL